METGTGLGGDHRPTAETLSIGDAMSAEATGNRARLTRGLERVPLTRELDWDTPVAPVERLAALPGRSAGYLPGLLMRAM